MEKIILCILICSAHMYGINLLENALDYNMIGIFEKLLHYGANPDGSDEHFPVLHAASVKDNPRYAQLLLEHGADPSKRNLHHWMPLHYASIYDKPIIIALLVQNGAPLDAPTSPDSQETSLHLAVTNLHGKATHALLKAGANTASTNIHGQTPLHELCMLKQNANPEKQIALIKLLLGYHPFHLRNEYINLQDTKGKRACDYLPTTAPSTLRDLVQSDQEKLAALRAKRRMGLTSYLRNREHGLARP